MKQALALFRQVYRKHQSIEIGIAELKRQGVSQLETVRVLMEVLGVSAVEADERVLNSLAWSN